MVVEDTDNSSRLMPIAKHDPTDNLMSTIIFNPLEVAPEAAGPEVEPIPAAPSFNNLSSQNRQLFHAAGRVQPPVRDPVCKIPRGRGLT